MVFRVMLTSSLPRLEVPKTPGRVSETYEEKPIGVLGAEVATNSKIDNLFGMDFIGKQKHTGPKLDVERRHKYHICCRGGKLSSLEEFVSCFLSTKQS